ncbi:MAG: hypothetical protein FWC24_03065 [Treponema sp.]|nr:hypothetical protein [Treponema sp.]
MKVPLYLAGILFLAVSCGGISENRIYYKCFFIAEDSFDIEGEIFVNDRLTEKADFEDITVKVEPVRGWEITGQKTTGNKFTLTVSTTANGITLSNDTINPDREPGLHFFTETIYSGMPDFPYHVLIFNVDGRRTRGAISPAFNDCYYYVYVPEAVDMSGKDFIESSSKFGPVNWYIFYDLNFYSPGWYKIYYAEDNPIGNKAEYSTGKNTKIRAPK